MSLDFVRIESDIAASSSVQLSSVFYDALRTFEVHFKAVSCTATCQSCAVCSKSSECPYRIVFAQQLSPDSGIVRAHQKPSLPFSLQVDLFENVPSCCTIGMVIVGSAINYVDIFHSALKRLIHFCISDRVPSMAYTAHYFTLDYQGIRHQIDDDDPLSKQIILLSAHHILLNSVHSAQMRLVLKSPLRLIQNGMIMHHFDFAAFFRSQMRRCSSLCAYYGTGEMQLDYTELSRIAQNVAVLENEIHYTRPPGAARYGKPGLTGCVECSGLVEPMFSLLLLGSYLNAGKGAAFGSGFYAIEVL